MKILVAFFLSGFFSVFAGVPVWAQSCSHIWPAFNTVPSAIAELEEGEDCLNSVVLKLWMRQPNTSNADLEPEIRGLKDKFKQLESDNSGLELEILNLQDELKQTELDLHAAKVRIETLQDQVSANQEHMEKEFTALLMARRSVSNPKPGASKPKSQANKPKPAVDSLKDR